MYDSCKNTTIEKNKRTNCKRCVHFEATNDQQTKRKFALIRYQDKRKLITVNTEEYSKGYSSGWKGLMKGLYGRVLGRCRDNNDNKDIVAGGVGATFAATTADEDNDYYDNSGNKTKTKTT